MERIGNIIERTIMKLERPRGGSGFGDKFSEQMNSGAYDALFKGWDDCTLENFKTKEPEPGYSFNFLLSMEGETDVEMTLFAKAKLTAPYAKGQPSKFYKILTGMYGSVPTEEFLASDEKIEQFFKSSIDQKFKALLGSNEKGYTTFLSISKPSVQGKKKSSVVVTTSPTSDNDDDIPF